LKEQFSSAKFPATKFIVAINIIIFVAMVIVSGGQAATTPTVAMLQEWGANFGPLTLNGEWWRLFTSMFLHIGFVHIAFNMAALWNLGESTEGLFGTPRMLNIYLLSGLGGSCCSMLFNPGITSAGASGAIFGIYGALFAYFFANRKAMGKEAFLAGTKSATAFLALNIFMGIAFHFDNFCHVGGLITGFIVGSFYLPHPTHQFSKHPIIGTLLAMGTIVGLFQYAKSIPLDFNGMYYTSYARQLIKEDKYNAAMVMLERRLAKAPDDESALRICLYACLKTGQLPHGLEVAERIAKLDPEDQKMADLVGKLRAALSTKTRLHYQSAGSK